MAFVVKWLSDCFTGPSDQSDECHLLENFSWENRRLASARVPLLSNYAPSNPFFSEMKGADVPSGIDSHTHNTSENVVNVQPRPFGSRDHVDRSLQDNLMAMPLHDNDLLSGYSAMPRHIPTPPPPSPMARMPLHADGLLSDHSAMNSPSPVPMSVAADLRPGVKFDHDLPLHRDGYFEPMHDGFRRSHTVHEYDESIINHDSDKPVTDTYQPVYGLTDGVGCQGFKPKRKVKAPETYDGSSNPVSYARQFEILSALNGWNRSEMAMQLFASMKGPALDTLAEVSYKRQNCYEVLKKALIDRFDWQNTSEHCKARLRGRRRGQNEPLIELFHDIRKLARKAYPDGGDLQERNDPLQSTAIEFFLDALCDDDMVFMIRLSKPQTIDDAYELALRYESISLVTGLRGPLTRPGSSENHEPPKEVKIVCNKCGVAGHKVWFCPKMKCHGCGEYGHTRRDCTKTNKGG